jgi:hypothetical protein
LDETNTLNIIRRKKAMKYGIREICDVVLRAKARMKVGNKVFYKDEPVIYFDSLKTSSMEGAATTVYAQGGRGNSRLIAWEGERTVTFTMEDALISKMGLAILTGADVIDATEAEPVIVHTTERIEAKSGKFALSAMPSDRADIYAMELDDNGYPASEPYVCAYSATNGLTVISNEVYNTNKQLNLDTDKVLLVDYYVEHNNNAS